MKKATFVLILVLIFAAASGAYARCWVEGGTFYAASKTAMSEFVNAMQAGDQKRSQQMIDAGLVKSCPESSCLIIERTDEGIMLVNISDIGQVWTYKTYVHCI
jgi:hypothetical protein